jgi:hypothetical protein
MYGIKCGTNKCQLLLNYFPAYKANKKEECNIILQHSQP